LLNYTITSCGVCIAQFELFSFVHFIRIDFFSIVH
jgi:hypothetical protein